MYKRTMSFILVGLLLNLVFHTTVMANPEKDAKIALKVKTAIAKLGTGAAARVKIKLRDKTKIKGYISETGEDSFSVINDKTNTAIQIRYSKVKQVQGKNSLTGEEIVLIGFGIAVIIWLAIFALGGED